MQAADKAHRAIQDQGYDIQRMYVRQVGAGGAYVAIGSAYRDEVEYLFTVDIDGGEVTAVILPRQDYVDDAFAGL